MLRITDNDAEKIVPVKPDDPVMHSQEWRGVSNPQPDQVAVPPPIINTLIEAITGLGKIVAALDQRMAVVESLAAQQSVAPPAPEAPPAQSEAVVVENFRETMWNRAAQRLSGQEPESFLPDTPPPAEPRPDPVCKQCREKPRYGPSKYCLGCLQEQNRNRCPRCGTPLDPESNGCTICATEARRIGQLKPGPRVPLGEMTHDTVDMLAEFPA